ncbi:hypothetical protein N657DRAFT_286539 [Parathielavia appendiculata]|uniref:Secreted protein n=1 Tax=Parathielavia appendiculata TaxID=2587402 RepID=A0AAN6Z6G3_9PEZI|nr:hypothetical protein N657DRAFT_286539 [Parathielavia appendiculata]
MTTSGVSLLAFCASWRCLARRKGLPGCGPLIRRPLTTLANFRSVLALHGLHSLHREAPCRLGEVAAVPVRSKGGGKHQLPLDCPGKWLAGCRDGCLQNREKRQPLHPPWTRNNWEHSITFQNTFLRLLGGPGVFLVFPSLYHHPVQTRLLRPAVVLSSTRSFPSSLSTLRLRVCLTGSIYGFAVMLGEQGHEDGSKYGTWRGPSLSAEAGSTAVDILPLGEDLVHQFFLSQRLA